MRAFFVTMLISLAAYLGTDYFDSIAEMLASHEEACREAQRD